MAPPARQTKSPGWALTTRPVFMGSCLPFRIDRTVLASLQALLDDQCKRHRIEEVRHEAADDHERIKVVRMVVRDDRDRDVHHDPDNDGIEQCHQRCFISATAEVRPREGEQHAPGETKEEVNSRADEVSQRSKRLLDLLAEHQARRIARDPGHRHEMLYPYPDNRFVNPDDDTAGQASEEAGADDLLGLSHGDRVVGRECGHDDVSSIAGTPPFDGRFLYWPPQSSWRSLPSFMGRPRPWY